MSTPKLLHPVTIDEPIVVIPMDDYHTLLAEAGYLPTPQLSQHIAAARTRFRKGRTIPWELLKRELR